MYIEVAKRPLGYPCNFARRRIFVSSTKMERSRDSEEDEDTASDLSVRSKLKTCDNVAVVTQHYNSLGGGGLVERNRSRIVYMRNFNNWVKSTLINKYFSKIQQEKAYGSPLNVLDMCCGKGGDLLKWRKGNVTHLICADIADVSVEQCKQRYEDILKRNSYESGVVPSFSAEFITADCTRVYLKEKYKNPEIQLDLVSCQFAFHYCFESLPQAECMLKNASECLKPGGYFIGTIPDAYHLVSKWQRSDDNKFGNDIYNVEFLCENKTDIPLFGAKYNFQLEGVVNCPEFLVHFPTLCKLALKFDLKLVMFERFDHYFEIMKGETKSLLERMQALETYPPYHENPLVGNQAQDYKHAAQYMQNLPGHRKIGTLSESEWEVISLYAVFAFQKIKATKDTEEQSANATEENLTKEKDSNEDTKT